MKNAPTFVCTIFLALVACGPVQMSVAGVSGELPDFDVRTWTRSRGLPGGSVNAILQTRDGYLWIGTSAGLARFDGARFTEVPLAPSRSGTPAVTALCDDTSGRLWVGSEQDGLYCVSGDTARRLGKTEGLLDESITCLGSDAEGGVWVGTRRGANRWDEHGFVAFTQRDGLPDDLISGIHATRSGAVWITTRGGMCSFAKGRLSPFEFQAVSQGRNAEYLDAYEDQRGNLWAFGATYLINLTEGKRLNYFLSDQPTSVRIWSLCEGRDGRIWIGTSGRGLFWFDGNRFQPVTLGEAPWGNDVRAICEDREGNLWLGLSEGGLARLRPQRFALIKATQGLPPGPANCVALDSLGRVNVGLESGGTFVNLGRRFERLLERDDGLGQQVGSTLCSGKNGTLWVGTAGAGLFCVRGGRTARFTTANGLGDDHLQALCSATNGNVWAGTRGGTLHRLEDRVVESFNRDNGLSGLPVTALCVSQDGGLWVGTLDGLLWRRGQSKFQRFRLAPQMTGKPVLALYEDASGRLWIGSRGGGLGCIVGRRCFVWGKGDGLPDDIISGLTDDADGNVWLVTGGGVCRVSLRAQATGGKSAGGATAQVTQLSEPRLVYEWPAETAREAGPGGPRAVRAPDGMLWFATPEGLLKVEPRDWIQSDGPPAVHLESLLVNNQPVAVPPPNSGPIRVPANLRSLEIQFTALAFAEPEKLRFRHKLEGSDADWVDDSGTERRVRYGRLQGGRYDFQVTARKGDGDWNEAGAGFAFIVPTPLWRSPVVLVFYGITAAGGIVGIVRLVSHRRLRRRLQRLQEQQAMERERVRIAQDMHDEIGSKLTKISFLSEHAKVELRQAERESDEPGEVVSGQSKGAPDAQPVPVAAVPPGSNAARSLANKIESIADTSREVLQALDEIVWAVNPRNDTMEHLAAYLGQYATEYFQNTPIECELHLPAQLQQRAMSAEVRHNVFLAFEESLNNILKHSGASRVNVEIMATDGDLRITVTDNGHGFDCGGTQAGTEAAAVAPRGNAQGDASLPTGGGKNKNRRRGGNGLYNMRQRLTNIGGECRIHSSKGGGTAVHFNIRLKDRRPEDLPGRHNLN